MQWVTLALVETFRKRKNPDSFPMAANENLVLACGESVSAAKRSVRRHTMETHEIVSSDLTIDGVPGAVKFEGFRSAFELGPSPPTSGTVVFAAVLSLQDSTVLQTFLDDSGPVELIYRSEVARPVEEKRAIREGRSGTWHCAHLLYEIPKQSSSNELSILHEVVLLHASPKTVWNEAAMQKSTAYSIDGHNFAIQFLAVQKIIDISHDVDAADQNVSDPRHLTELTYSEFELSGEPQIHALAEGQPVRLTYLPS